MWRPICPTHRMRWSSDFAAVLLMSILAFDGASAGPCAQCDTNNVCIYKETSVVYPCSGEMGMRCAKNASMEHGGCDCLEEVCSEHRMPPPTGYDEEVIHECYSQCLGGRADCEKAGDFEPTCLLACLETCLDTTPAPKKDDNKCAKCDKTGACMRLEDKVQTF
eukprot:jgi/Bigna1/81288/fgenesh1_pg.79_\